MVALKELAEEAFWFDKYRYEDAERQYYEKMAKGGSGAESSNFATFQSSLASEIARARQHIKNSLECGDSETSVLPLTSELTNKVSALEKENANIKKICQNLESLVKHLDFRVTALESRLKSAESTSAKSPAKQVKEEDDDDIDLFGSDNEEDAEAERIRQERLTAYAEKKSKKPGVIAKSSVVLDIKPWDDETDMKAMEKMVLKVTMEGLTWGAAKLVPLAYGIKKLQIMCTVVDDLVSVEELTEKIEEIDDLVQSVDIAAFNKI